MATAEDVEDAAAVEAGRAVTAHRSAATAAGSRFTGFVDSARAPSPKIHKLASEAGNRRLLEDVTSRRGDARLEHGVMELM